MLHPLLALLATLAPATAQEADVPDAARYWPQWRGPLATGEAPHAAPPLEWSEEENVRWKLALPGRGQSTPVVWGDRVFLTTAVPVGDALEPEPDRSPGAHDNAPVTHRQSFEVLAVSRASGEILWRRALREELPHERAHVSAGFASASPVTDGEHVFAFFGSRGLYALDLEGELVWEKDLGDMQAKHGHGEGASPALHDDTLVVNWDHEGPSFLVALDKRTGEERWRVAREENTSWSTPLVVEHDGRALVVVAGSQRLAAHDLRDGALVWECAGLSYNVVATPVHAAGRVFAASSYEKQSMLAIDLAGAEGDLTTSDNLAWVRRRRTPYVPSPLLYRDALWFLHHYQGTLCRVLADSGEEPVGPFRLDGIGDVYASPVAAAGRVYLLARDGTCVVISAEDEPRYLALNRLDDEFDASPVAVDEELLLRGAMFLYCLAE